ncbi:MAG: TonB-dependent receptor, partial [Candidatus Omnitrophica bacterium]|nr:TonB-dependent receptor [Candidatus Omnitrophota bacterium]
MKKRIFILVGMLIVATTTGVCAEENRFIYNKAIELKPITVTVSRTARTISESPASVSIVTNRDIAQTNAKSVADLLKSIEGIYMYDPSGVGATGAVVNMRGFYGGMSSHQLVLVDGIPQNKGKDKLIDWDLLSMDNIESIEIVRGPASALYGDNAMSGVINIITKKPKDKPESKFLASYGSFNTQEYETSTLGTYKQLGYFMGASYKTSDGFRRHGDYDKTHVGGKLDYTINDAQALKLSLDYSQKERGALSWALTEAQIAQDRRQARPGTKNDKSEETKGDVSIVHAWDVSDQVNTEATFYYKYDDANSFYTSGSAESTKREQLDDEDVYGLLLKGGLKQEILGLRHEFTGGVDLERDNFDYEEYNAPYQQRGSLRSDYEVRRDKIGPFLQDEIKLIDPLRLIAGVRYDRVNFDFDDKRTLVNSKKEKMSKVTPRCGMVYMYQRDSSLYVNYAQAFRTPTIGQMFTYASSANPDLKPEDATNYEIGLHHRISELLRTNVSFYWMELDNEIWYDYATNKYQNYGKTSHKGIETSLDFKIVKWLSGFANYTYSRAKNKAGSYSGKYLTNIPMHKASSGLHCTSKFGLSWDLAVTYVGSSYIDSTNNNKLSSFTTADTKVSYEYKAMNVFLAIDNLFAKKFNS